MGNQRVFYACQGVCFNDVPVEGVQSVTLDTQQDTINLDQWGTMKVHGVVPNYPKVDVNLSRIISSGTLSNLIYSGTLQDNINTHDHSMCLFIGEDTKRSLGDSTSNNYNIFLSGVSINSVSYDFSSDGNLTENVNLIAYNKFYNSCPVDQTIFAGLSGTDVFRRQHIDIDNCSIGDILQSGTRIQSISIDSNFGIQNVDEFGMNVANPDSNYRYAQLPIETTLQVEIIIQGSGLDFYEIDPITGVSHLCEYTGLSSLVPLNVKLCEGLSINLGSGILTDVSYNGGSTGGDNVIAALTFKSVNHLTVANTG